MSSKKTVVIEDANVWISFLIGSKYRDIVNVLDDPEYRIVYCKDLIEELYASLEKPKLAKRYTRNEVNALVAAIKAKAVKLDINPPYPERTRDKKDDYLLELAKQSEANYLVSGDKDLLDIGQFEKTEIVSLAAFAVKYYTAKTEKYKKISKEENSGGITKKTPSNGPKR